MLIRVPNRTAVERVVNSGGPKRAGVGRAFGGVDGGLSGSESIRFTLHETGERGKAATATQSRGMIDVSVRRLGLISVRAFVYTST